MNSSSRFKSRLAFRYIVETCAICIGVALIFGELYMYAYEEQWDMFLRFGLGFASLLSLGCVLAIHSYLTIVRPLQRLRMRVSSFRVDSIMSDLILIEVPEQAQHELDEIERFICELLRKLQVQHSEVVQARNNLLRLNQNLEAELEIRRQQLEQQLADAVHDNKLNALGEMAAGIAHEINNPLAILIGRIEQLRAHLKGDSKSESNLSNMEKSIFRIQEAMMDLEMISSNPSSEDFRRLTLTRVVKRLNKVAANRYELHEVYFELDLEAEVVILGREVELTQALLYVLENAAHAAACSREKWVRLRLAQNQDGQCLIEISDSGEGVDETIRDKVFQPFFSTKEKGRGTGLSRARSIIEGHGGSIAFDFNANVTTVSITLPCHSSLRVMEAG